MKQLLRKFKQISVLILAIAFIGCEDEDAVLPQVLAGFTYTIDSDTRTVTFINTSENAQKYDWSLGDGKTSALINPVKTYGIGSYTVVLKAKNVAGDSDTFEDIIVFLDQDVPLITLLGDSTINLTLGDIYTDPGATALDEVDGDLTSSIVVGGDTVDTNTEGTYTITYNVSDAQGNAAVQVERTVTVIALPIAPTTSAPVPPARDAADVISVYGEAYTNVAVSNFDPNWGQSGHMMVNTAYNPGDGNLALAYPNFNYQGTDIASPQDASAMEFLHIDIWVPTGTDRQVKVSPISGGEFLVEVPLTPGSWNSVDIPVGDFTGLTLNAVGQIKFDGQFNGDGSANTTPYDIYLDNIYFHKAPGSPSSSNLILDFENNLTGIGVDAFESAGELLANPVSGGINTSSNVYAITYGSGNQWWGGVGFVVGSAALSDADTEYKVKLYSTVAPINVLFEVEQNGVGGTTIGNTQEITTANEWVEVTFTLQGGAGIDRVLVRPAVGDATGTKTHDGILYVDDIASVEGVAGPDCPDAPAGELLSNGDFEADNGAGTCIQVNSNDNGGVAEISSAEANGGTYSGHLITGEAQFPNFKWERFAPTTTGGVTIEVSFKYKFTTSLGVGSIFQVLAFSEFTAGAQEHNLGNATDAPLNTWNTFTGTFETHADIAEGLSLVLQLTGSGNAGGAGEVYIDDVKVTQL